MSGIEILFLSKEDVDALDLGLQEVMDAIERGLEAHGRRQVIMPSKDHLPLDYPEKLFNILKGYVEPINTAGVTGLINRSLQGFTQTDRFSMQATGKEMHPDIKPKHGSHMLHVHGKHTARDDVYCRRLSAVAHGSCLTF